jgi:hypothetical protein
MKGIAVAAAAGLLIASFVCPGTPRAQQSEPDKTKPPKLTLSEVEAQVVTLQAQVATQQTALNALHPEDFAVVDSTGNLVRGSSSVVSASADGSPGNYQVIFNKDVSGRAYVATLGETDSVGAVTPGEISVSGLLDNDDGVFIQTANSAGTITASSFHLSVSCS